MSLKFVTKGPINNIPALVLIMALRWPGDKPLYKQMMVNWLIHRYFTGPQWVNWQKREKGPSMDKWLHPLWSVGWNYLSIPKLQWCNQDKMADISQTTFSNAFYGMKICEFRLIFHSSLQGQINNSQALVQIMASDLPGDKSLSEPMMINSLMHICIAWHQWVKRIR